VKKIFNCLFLLFAVISSLYSQASIDSVLQKRNNTYLDYNHFKEGMEVRTWINMVNLTDKANSVIEIDNSIIEVYLNNEIAKNRTSLEQIDKLKLEIILLQKELELKEIILEERQYLYNILIISIGILSVLFLIMLILFIDRQTRYRNAKMELERLWSNQNNNSNIVNEEQFQKLSSQINDLGAENIDLKKKMLDLQKAIDKKDDELNSEIKSKKLVEEEIKKLIFQLKNIRK